MGDWLLILSASTCVVILLLWVWRVVNWVWLKPKKLEKFLSEQGIKGNPYRFLYGDMKESMKFQEEAISKPMPLSNDIVPRLLPSFQQAVKKYGKLSVVWSGTKPGVIIMDPKLIRDILSNKFGHFEKPRANPVAKVLLTGMAFLEGEQWAKHRRIINPAFHLEKLKHMFPAFYTSSCEMVSRWEKLVTSKGLCELDVWPELQTLTADGISRAAFGSSYEEGKQIFQLQNEQVELVLQVAQSIYIPGWRFLPTKRNRRMKQIEREVKALLMGIINKREKAIKVGEANNDDLLGLLMESNAKEIQEQGINNKKSVGMSIDDVIQECKLFYFAGKETTSVLLVWTMVLLGMNPTWQVRAREEVFKVFGDNKLNFDGLSHLKIVTMILYEVLRLYPPVNFLGRTTYKEMKIGNITLPAGVELSLITLLIHHDRELWGNDAQEFKPERFSEGISKATKGQVCFFPFGWGPRICIGQNFALAEAKIALAMILQRFSFDLSPSYAHAPHTILTIRPQFGAQVILSKI